MRLLESALAFLVVVGALLSRHPRHRLPPGVDAEDLAGGYERSDANVAWIIAAGVALLAALGGVLLVVNLFGAYVTGLPVTIGRPPDLVDRLNPVPTPPPPRLETQEGQDLSAYRAAADQTMNSYAWVDRQAGVVRLPIERAMAIVAQQGLPARQTSTASDDGAHLPSSASSGRVEEPSGP